MRYSRILSLLNGLLLSTNVASATTPTPLFSPYVDLTLNTHWDSNTQDLEPMDLITPAKNKAIKGYHLAFITDSGTCQPAWGGQEGYSIARKWGSHQAKELTQNGVEIAVSFGGANGTDVSHYCEQAQLVALFKETIELYHAKTLDFDIENGSADVPKLMQALKVTQQQHPKVTLSFTLPVMPEGLTYAGKEVVNLAKEAGLNFRVNIMAMDYGPGYTASMGAYAIQAATNLHQFLTELYPQKMPQTLWQSVEVTPMIGVNDVSVEQFTLTDADQLRAFAQKNQLGGLSYWSFARDRACSDKWASPVCSGNNLQSHDYEFLEHLQ